MKHFIWLHRKLLFLLTRAEGRRVRVWALRRLGFSVGRDVYVGPHLTMAVGYADTHMQLSIGDRVSFGPNVTLILATHSNNSRLNAAIPQPPRRIAIGEDSWIGAGAIIMPDVTIGKCCIIGAGAVVTHDIPNYSVAVGVPARVIKKVEI